MPAAPGVTLAVHAPLLTTALTHTVGAAVLLADIPTRTASDPGDTVPESASVAPSVTAAPGALMLTDGGVIVKLLEIPITAGLVWSRTRREYVPPARPGTVKLYAFVEITGLAAAAHVVPPLVE
jgi:hypothetical protein